MGGSGASRAAGSLSFKFLGSKFSCLASFRSSPVRRSPVRDSSRASSRKASKKPGGIASPGKEIEEEPAAIPRFSSHSPMIPSSKLSPALTSAALRSAEKRPWEAELVAVVDGGAAGAFFGSAVTDFGAGSLGGVSDGGFGKL